MEKFCFQCGRVKVWSGKGYYVCPEKHFFRRKRVERLSEKDWELEAEAGEDCDVIDIDAKINNGKGFYYYK